MVPDRPPSSARAPVNSGPPPPPPVVLTVASIVMSPNGGSFSSAQNVSLSTATEGAEIRYTLDGSVPTASSILYSGQISIASSQTVTAIAMKSGMASSSLSTASFIITLPPPPVTAVAPIARRMRAI